MGLDDAMAAGHQTHIGATARGLFQNVEQLLAVEEIPARHCRQFLAAGDDADLCVLHDANLVIFFHFGK